MCLMKLEPGCGVAAILVKSPSDGQGVHQIQAPAALGLGVCGPQHWHGGATAVGDLNADDLTVAETVTVIIWPGSREPLCRTLLVTSSLIRSTAVAPSGCRRPSTAAANARATATRSGRPAMVTLSRAAAVPAIARQPFNRPPAR